MKARLSFLAASCALVLLSCSCDGPSQTGVEPSGEVTYTLGWLNRTVKGNTRPVVDNVAVYFMDIDHVVTALDVQTGRTLWRTQLTYASPPALQGFGIALTAGRLVIGDQDVFGLDPATGRIQWRYASPLSGERLGHGHLTIDGATVYTGSVTGKVYAIDASTGGLKWATQVVSGDHNVNDPIVRDGKVYVALTLFTKPFGGGAAAVDAATGALLWTTVLPADPSLPSSTNQPAVSDQLVVLGAASGKVFGLDRQTGAIRFTLPSDLLARPGEQPGEKQYFLSSYGNTVYVATNAGVVLALDGSSLATQWKIEVPPAPMDVRAEADRLYLISSLGGLIALDAKTGAIAWRALGTDLRDSSGNVEIFVQAPATNTEKAFIVGRLAAYSFERK